MRAIFISYRRDDAEGQAGRLFDDLVSHFGEGAVFMDVAGIEPGTDFRRAIDAHVASCGVLLAVIGKSWLDAKDESGRRRLEDAGDFVRLETASALKRDIPVVPVLVQDAKMPRAEQLPSDLKELAYRNGVELTHARWDSDVQVLVKTLERHVKPNQEGAGSSGSPKKSRRMAVVAALTLLAIVIAGYSWFANRPEVSDEAAEGSQSQPPTDLPRKLRTVRSRQQTLPRETRKVRSRQQMQPRRRGRFAAANRPCRGSRGRFAAANRPCRGRPRKIRSRQQTLPRKPRKIRSRSRR